MVKAILFDVPNSFKDDLKLYLAKLNKTRDKDMTQKAFIMAAINEKIARDGL